MIFSSEKRFFFTLTLRMELSLFDFVQLCFGQFFWGGHTCAFYLFIRAHRT